MLGDELAESTLFRGIAAAAVLIIFILLALISRLLIQIFLKRIRRRDDPGIPEIILESMRGPFGFFLVSTGLLVGYLLAIGIENSILAQLSDTKDLAIKIWKVSVILTATFTVAHVVDRLIDWYLLNIAESTETKIDDTLLPTLRRVLPITIYAAGALVAIDSVGVSISPILAGLGIGGLAVALAVQPTLSNFFAGTYVVTEGELKEGDFIELEGGPSGYVEDVGWRSTKIRSRFNNLVIIPNSRMAESIVTNYFSPTPAMNVVVTCGVSYDANLEDVERFSVEEAQAVINDSDQAIKDVEPFFGFSNFGDSNIDFFVFLQAIDRTGTFTLKSELIKRIHERFNVEGIEINYPVRKIVYSEPVNSDQGGIFKTESDEPSME
ncbi:MAG: mechanosensitive ion channel family protein [SAR202 cluster bacterium]|jgi:small-conductance mechanosensitive channel|nr:mechanosensitive ion channel family protein [SAR202 cluster bacterium]